MDSEIYKGIGLAIGGVIIALTPYIKKWFDGRKLSTRFNDNIQARSEIKTILDEIRIRSNASRVNIMDYHNGKENILGVPFNYVSMFSESTDRQTAGLIKEIQQFPIEPVVPILVRLISSKSGWIYTTDMDKEEEIAVLQKSYGCASSYTFMMKESIASGSLVVSYSAPPKRHLNENEIRWIKSQIIRLNNLRLKIKKH